MLWYDTIWYDTIRYDMIWYDIHDIWYDMIWYMMYDMIWYTEYMIWYDMIWYDVIWCDLIWSDLVWYGCAPYLVYFSLRHHLKWRLKARFGPGRRHKVLCEAGCVVHQLQCKHVTVIVCFVRTPSKRLWSLNFPRGRAGYTILLYDFPPEFFVTSVLSEAAILFPV